MWGNRLKDWKTMPMRRRMRLTSTPRGDLLALDDDAARVDRLQQVDAAQQRGLPRTRGADQAHHLVLGHLEVDAAQHLELAERLADALEQGGVILARRWRRGRGRPGCR